MAGTTLDARALVQLGHMGLQRVACPIGFLFARLKHSPLGVLGHTVAPAAVDQRLVGLITVPEFAQAQAAIAKRKLAAAKAVATKTARLVQAIQAMPITVERLKLSRLQQLAIDSYNARSSGHSFASRNDDPAFLERITVNFVRHELTQYDQALWEAAGKTGIAQAVTEIRRRVYGAIAQAYPSLCDECARQLGARI